MSDTPAAATGIARPCYLVLSAHDYRTPRRANIHFITDQLALRGTTRFFSLRYSRLSRMKGDMRLPLDETANTVVSHKGVDCYLWRTTVHPFNTRRAWLRAVEDAMFRWYAAHPPRQLLDWMREADVIVFESGIAVAFIELAKRINPAAKLVYRASDALSTINVASYIEREFDRVAPTLDVIALVSPAMAEEVASRDNVYHVGHGVDHNLDQLGDPSPYGEGIHAVAVGSMLFDPEFFVVASKAFPHVTFHVIGSGMGRHPGYGDNVTVYGEMKHVETIGYIKHARFGIAPYASEQVPIYLADSSMKLLQYDFFGLPAVCPNVVVGPYQSRFGYTPGDADSIIAAIGLALEAPHVRYRQCLNWSDTTDRVLNPGAYPETRLYPQNTGAAARTSAEAALSH
ncbi:glycosyltransferase [Xanthomonas hortorum]|uniref:Glycosyltransferase family 1 protein n=2 Tax=Xanthomonas hortorum TaxID=56454 RepID=A0A6V7CRH9_9XANT|nr:glycosyltransferase [Xanthomonas hortorum]MCE4354209.1 glycosyltransferase [Xanthomonas hortorum pv. pelargonii]MCM5523613.1 glycosyltransferase [Xanthomonas hortorum pv. pelargonii]MCM5535378.1 glycosyltransferase [Xanthomonas hortorum pv. pelargonii]MCM5539551.1 glycosyltransferase [Xanthomonas hortorum pv. pelargonii]MCM5544508.1 glycosyltransferase [Xanthomonas hortorum pv. pelargonii]